MTVSYSVGDSYQNPRNGEIWDVAEVHSAEVIATRDGVRKMFLRAYFNTFNKVGRIAR